MDGRRIFSFAVRQIPATISEALGKAGLEAEDVDLFLLHQANRRILEGIAGRLDADLGRFPMNLDQVGNTSSASIPLLLDGLNRQGRLHRGMEVKIGRGRRLRRGRGKSKAEQKHLA